MILHVTFSDGSNPWVSFSHDRKTITKQWRRWIKHHPETASPVVMLGGYECRRSAWYNGYFITGGNGENYRQYYKYLGCALAAIEKLGGAKT